MKIDPQYREFWRTVFLEAIRAGGDTNGAALKADRAVTQYKNRCTP